MYAFLAALASSVAHCDIQPLSSIKLWNVNSCMKSMIQQIYRREKSQEDPDTVFEFALETNSWVQQLALFAVKENEGFRNLSENDKFQLAEIVTYKIGIIRSKIGKVGSYAGSFFIYHFVLL